MNSHLCHRSGNFELQADRRIWVRCRESEIRADRIEPTRYPNLARIMCPGELKLYPYKYHAAKTRPMIRFFLTLKVFEFILFLSQSILLSWNTVVITGHAGTEGYMEQKFRRPGHRVRVKRRFKIREEEVLPFTRSTGTRDRTTEVCIGMEGGSGAGTHSVFQLSKKQQDFKYSGFLSTMVNLNPGSVWLGTDAAAREKQKHEFCQSHDLVHSSPWKSTLTAKLPYWLNFARIFRVYNQKHDSFQQSRAKHSKRNFACRKQVLFRRKVR